MRTGGQKLCANEMENVALNNEKEIPPKIVSTFPWLYSLQEHDFRTLPSVDFGVLTCSPLRDVKTLGFLKEHHSRTQIWGSNLSDKRVCLILRVSDDITLRYNYNCNCNCNYTCYYIALHYTTPITLHYTTSTTSLLYTTLHHTRLHYTIPPYSTQHVSTLHYTTLITPHHNYNCNYTTVITLHYNFYNYNYNRTTPHYIQQLWWGDHCNHFKKHSSQPLSVHQWIRSAIRDSQQPTSPIGFLSLKLPPPPCAVLLITCIRCLGNFDSGVWCQTCQNVGLTWFWVPCPPMKRLENWFRAKVFANLILLFGFLQHGKSARLWILEHPESSECSALATLNHYGILHLLWNLWSIDETCDCLQRYELHFHSWKQEDHPAQQWLRQACQGLPYSAGWSMQHAAHASILQQLIIRNCDRNTTCTVQMTGVLPGTWWKQMKANGSRRKHVLVSDKFQCSGYVLMVSKPNKSTIPIYYKQRNGVPLHCLLSSLQAVPWT